MSNKDKGIEKMGEALSDSEEETANDGGVFEEGEEEEVEEGEGEEGEEGEEEEPSTEDKYKAAIAELTAEIQDLKAQMKSPKEESIQFSDVTFFEDDETFSRSNAKSFNEVLNKGLRTNNEAILKAIPQIVTRAAQQQVAMMRAADKFYEENPELGKYRPFVGKLFAKEMSDDPSLTLEKALDKVADRAYSKLGLMKKAKAKTKGKGTNLPSARGSKATPTKKKGGSAAEIDAMNAALGL